MMKDWIKIVHSSPQMMKLQLRDLSCLDLGVFQKMEVDQNCLNGVWDANTKTITYMTNDYIRLEDVFAQHVFEAQEGYAFLLHLFDDMINANRNKPVLMEPDFVFVSPYGDAFRFIVVPVGVEKWMQQEDICQVWIPYLCKHIQTTTSFEIIGFMMKFLESKEVSLTNLMFGLKAMQKRYYPSRLFRNRKQKSFKVAEPMHGMYKVDEKPEIIRMDDSQTHLLQDAQMAKAYLVIDHERYDLIHEVNLIGRSMACDIRLDESEVSIKHAKIVCENNRFYICDLKSSNGTFLNEKRVQRKMRLKEGMILRFAGIEGIFHEIQMDSSL